MGAKLFVRPDRQAYRAGEALTVYFEVCTRTTKIDLISRQLSLITAAPYGLDDCSIPKNLPLCSWSCCTVILDDILHEVSYGHGLMSRMSDLVGISAVQHRQQFDMRCT